MEKLIDPDHSRWNEQKVWAVVASSDDDDEVLQIPIPASQREDKLR